jgi:RNA polymerase sigma-70 factor (ECF subfamily)
VTPLETEQFAALWSKSCPTILAFIRAINPRSDQAEEILQRVAVTLVRRFADYDSTKPFTAWAIGIAKNELMYFRRQWATDKHLFDDQLLAQLATSFQRLSEDDNPAQAALTGCLEQLTGRARTAIHLRYSDDLSCLEIAAKMRLSSGAVRMLLYRARVLLRECIERKINSPRPA